MPAFVLNERDKRLLQELLADYRRRRGSAPGTIGWTGEDQQAPEVYIAIAPDDGIPALTSGTPDEPGVADCELFRIIYSGGVPELVAGPTLRKVHNLTQTVIPALSGTDNNWTVVVRDKYGKWLALPFSGAATAIKWAAWYSGANGAGGSSREFYVKACAYNGTLPTGDAFAVNTPLRPNKDTALFSGHVVGYQTEADGVKVIVTDCWDDPIGTVKSWNSVGDLRDGWQELTGQKGRYLRGVDPANAAGLGVVTVGSTGGNLCHTHCDHGSNLFSYTTGLLNLYAFSDIPGSCIPHIDPWLGALHIERFQ